MTKGYLLGALLWAVAGNASAADWDIWLREDVAAIQSSRNGLAQTLRFLDEHPHILETGRGVVPPPAEREALRAAWQTFVDHIIALDVIGDRNDRWYEGAFHPDREAAFEVSFAAFLSQYRYALDFLQRTERSAALHTLLNEAMPELGLPAGTYAEIKFRFLNVLRAAEFSRRSLLHLSMHESAPLAPLVKEDIAYILKVNEHGGPALTAKNAGQVVKDTVFTTWFPVQKGVSEWMGDTKVARRDSLISVEQLHELQPRLEPGDVLLVRREWYLSNIGLPGFWPHAAMYIGTAAERRAYFDDPAVREWVKGKGEASGSLEALLASADDGRYQRSGELPDGKPVRVIEAISEGVTFTTLEHAGGGDSMVVLRPRRGKVVKARAVLRAFGMAGRPYDFDFDFLTDSALVCTELVYKSYEGDEGLNLPLQTVLGRPVLPANAIASLFDAEYGKPSRQFDFVAFLDGQEWAGRAVAADVDAFRGSWRRPKWHIMTQRRDESPKLAGWAWPMYGETELGGGWPIRRR